MQKDLQDLGKMSMEEILEKNRDKEVGLGVVVHPNVLDHIPSSAPEADPELDYKGRGPEIVDLIPNLSLGGDLFRVEDVNRRREDQLLEEGLLQGNDPFLEGDRDLFLENGDRDLFLENGDPYQEEDPEDRSLDQEGLCQDLDKEDLYQDPEDLYLDLAIGAKTRKSTNLEVDQETERSLVQNHLESRRNLGKGNIQREKHKVDQDQKEGLVLGIGNKLTKLWNKNFLGKEKKENLGVHNGHHLGRDLDQKHHSTYNKNQLLLENGPQC